MACKAAVSSALGLLALSLCALSGVRAQEAEECNFTPTCRPGERHRVAIPCAGKCEYYFDCNYGDATEKKCGKFLWHQNQFDHTRLECVRSTDCDWWKALTTTPPAPTTTSAPTTTPAPTSSFAPSTTSSTSTTAAPQPTTTAAFNTTTSPAGTTTESPTPTTTSGPSGSTNSSTEPTPASTTPSLPSGAAAPACTVGLGLLLAAVTWVVC